MSIQVEGTAIVKVERQETIGDIEKLQNKVKNLRKEICALHKQEIIDEAKRTIKPFSNHNPPKQSHYTFPVALKLSVHQVDHQVHWDINSL